MPPSEYNAKGQRVAFMRAATPHILRRPVTCAMLATDNSDADGHVDAARTQRADEPSPQQGHKARMEGATAVAPIGLSVSAARWAASGTSRSGVSWSTEGHLHSRLFLASASKVSKLPDAEIAARVLGAKTARESRTRSAEPARNEKAWLGLPGRVGVRSERPRSASIEANRLPGRGMK